MVYKQDSYFCKYFDLKILEIFWSLFNLSHSQLARNNHYENWLYWGRKKCPLLIFCFHYSKKSIIYAWVLWIYFHLDSINTTTIQFQFCLSQSYRYRQAFKSITGPPQKIIWKTISIVLRWSCNINCYSCFWILLECEFHEDKRFCCCCLVHTTE